MNSTVMQTVPMHQFIGAASAGDDTIIVLEDGGSAANAPRVKIVVSSNQIEMTLAEVRQLRAMLAEAESKMNARLKAEAYSRNLCLPL